MTLTSVQRNRSFATVIARLRRHYGAQPRPPRDAWELIVREVASYLVDDERRDATYRRLAKEIGKTPDAILDAEPRALQSAIADGGMLAQTRGEKLRKSARVAIALGDLKRIVALPIDEAVRALKKFPGIGQPGAERILLFTHRQRVLALDSNGLRVVVRLGFSDEKKGYDATWRAAKDALAKDVANARSHGALIEAHQLLRLHGKEICTRTRPLCERCPVASQCAFYAVLVARRNA